MSDNDTSPTVTPGSSPVLLRYASVRRWASGGHAALLCAASFAFCLIVMAAIDSLSWSVDLLVALLFTGFVAFYLRAVKHTVNERWPQAWQWNVPLPERQWNITNDDVDRVRFVLVEDAYDLQLGPVREDRILLMVRRHWVYVVVRTAIPVLLGISFLLLSIVIGTVRLRIPWGGLPNAQKTPTVHQFTFIWTWWAFLLLVAVCFLSAVVLALRWKYTYLLVTNWNVIVAWVPPVLFPWLQPLTPRLKLLAIDTADNDNPMLGRWLQYGTIIVDSPATKDQKNFGEMRWWPYHRKIIELIEAAIMNATVHNRSSFLP